MAQQAEKRKASASEVAEIYTLRLSDTSDDEEQSEAESEMSEVDSVAEDMFLEGMDVLLDRDNGAITDPDWEPDREDLAEFRMEMDEPELSSVSAAEPERDSSPSKIRRTETATKRVREWGRGRGKVKGRDHGATLSSLSKGRWNSTRVADITPTPFPFCPKRTPGPQLIHTADYTCLGLFQLFFNDTVLSTLIRNTNAHGRSAYATWTDITLKELFSVLALVIYIYMGLTKVPSLTDYWRRGKLYSLPFPKSVMAGRRFLSVLRAIHLSSPKDDAKNESKRGTEEFDRLCKIKPLYTEMRDACRQNHQPDQHISIDERMVASKARVNLKQYMKNKPVRWSYKLFVLVDLKTGYTWDFFVHDGKSCQASKNGMSYDSVMHLLDTSLLGTGYKLYVDHFYTSATLFRDLLRKKVSACGTIKTSGRGYPRTTENTLDSQAPRGTIRWIREDSLLFVQWRDTRDVSICTTMHTAHGEDTVERRVKNSGRWTMAVVPIPPAIKDYNKHMGGVDRSDALIQHYEVLHKTKKWYKTFFYHFVDIAVVNSFILYKEHCASKGEIPMHQKAFRETLVLELVEAGANRTQQQEKPQEEKHHRLVYITPGSDKTEGRLRCRKCHAKTPVKCSTCDMPLCFQPQRDCYNDWHKEQRC